MISSEIKRSSSFQMREIEENPSSWVLDVPKESKFLITFYYLGIIKCYIKKGSSCSMDYVDMRNPFSYIVIPIIVFFALIVFGISGEFLKRWGSFWQSLVFRKINLPKMQTYEEWIEEINKNKINKKEDHDGRKSN